MSLVHVCGFLVIERSCVRFRGPESDSVIDALHEYNEHLGVYVLTLFWVVMASSLVLHDLVAPFCDGKEDLGFKTASTIEHKRGIPPPVMAFCP
jgi:hypothetical protein